MRLVLNTRLAVGNARELLHFISDTNYLFPGVCLWSIDGRDVIVVFSLGLGFELSSPAWRYCPKQDSSLQDTLLLIISQHDIMQD
jgi:hypothetical protein